MTKRYNILPIVHDDLWKRYKAVEGQFWRAQDGDFSEDEFDSLDESQQKYLKMLLCFFSVSDAVVADNLAINFLQEDIPAEAAFFYSYQLANENIHNETYGLLIDAYFKNEKEKEEAFNAVETIPTVARKMNWAYKWIENGSFEEKLIAFAAVEGILFSSTFCGIFGFKKLNKNLPGLYWANKEISRDEQTHYDFATHYYNNHVEFKLSNDKVREIIMESYEIEKQFIEDCFVYKPTGFNHEQMIQYLQYVTDTILFRFNLSVEFNVEQPFKYMEEITIPRRDNFFEGRSSEYGALTSTEIDVTLEDF